MIQRLSYAFQNEKFQAAQTVLSAQDFYDCADEHFDWAETAKTSVNAKLPSMSLNCLGRSVVVSRY